MGDDDRVLKVLEEIRDLEKESLTEYRRVTQQSLELQRQAVGRQEQMGRLYRRMVLIGSALVIPLVLLLVFLLVRWSDRLFR